MPNNDAMKPNNSPSTISNDVDISPIGTEKKPRKIKTIPEIEKITDNIVCTLIKISNLIFSLLHIFTQKKKIFISLFIGKVRPKVFHHFINTPFLSLSILDYQRLIADFLTCVTSEPRYSPSIVNSVNPVQYRPRHL